jgi:hypothetical protein
VGEHIPLEDCQFNRGSLFSALPASSHDFEDQRSRMTPANRVRRIPPNEAFIRGYASPPILSCALMTLHAPLVTCQKPVRWHRSIGRNPRRIDPRLMRKVPQVGIREELV